MACTYRRHRNDRRHIVDSPLPWDLRSHGEEHHGYDAKDRECHAELKSFQHLWYFEEKVRVFDFFGCGTPCHIDFEHVRKNRLRHV